MTERETREPAAGFSLEQPEERLDDGTQPVADATATPLLSPSFWPKVWGLLLFVAILISAYAAINAPPRPERPAPDEPWTPSSGLCEGMTALECKWN